MNELTTLPDMTLEEFTVKHGALKSMDSAMRVGLLEIRDRNGWKAGGFSSWADYGEKEWNYDQRHLNRLATAAHIQNIVRPIGLETIPESHLRPLTTIDDAEKKRVFDDAVELAREEGKKLGAKHVEEAVGEWKAKHESAQKRINWLEIDREGTLKQNDQLRNDLAFKVDAKVAEAKAQLILENQQAIANEKRKAENLASELERLKREQAKAIQDGVSLEKNKIQTELNQIVYQIEVNKRDFEELQKAKRELDAEVGAIAVHKDAIKHIKNDLTSLACHFSDAFETQTIPPETVSDWTAIYDALNKLVTKMRDWRENNTLIGELVD
jgi:hypothetical protein